MPWQTSPLNRKAKTTLRCYYLSLQEGCRLDDLSFDDIAEVAKLQKFVRFWDNLAPHQQEEFLKLFPDDLTCNAMFFCPDPELRHMAFEMNNYIG